MSGRGDGTLIRQLKALHARNPAARAVLSAPVSMRRKLIDWRSAPGLQVAQTAAQRIADDVKLDMPEFDGQFWCPPTSHLFRRIMLHNRYEPEVGALIREHVDPDRDMVDVGANIGFFSVLAARLMRQGRVLAVEPSGSAFARLQRNIDLNRVSDRVTLFHGALSDHAGEADLHQIDGKEEYASLAPIRHAAVADEPAQTQPTKIETLDNLGEDLDLSPALVKIDVEGAEMSVLHGAGRTIAKHRPVILCELAGDLLDQFGTTPDAILQWLRERDYDIRDVADPRRAPDSRLHGEIVCLPR